MRWTPRIEKAMKLAAILHHGQSRKESEHLPHFYHVTSVAMIAASYTDDEDTIIAALLHDTIEDTPYSFEELEQDFGSNVRDIVKSVTYPVDQTKVPWEERHVAYKENLSKGSPAAFIVSAADKIHNFYTLRAYMETLPKEKRTASVPNEVRVRVYGDLVDMIESQLSNDIVIRLKEEFALYKKALLS